MIVFYSKVDGKIVGTIDGRIHSEDHLKMWVGDPKNTKRLICNWVGIPGTETKDDTGAVISMDFEPEVEGKDQKEIFFAIDKSPSTLRNYKVDIKTQKLIKI